MKENRVKNKDKTKSLRIHNQLYTEATHWNIDFSGMIYASANIFLKRRFWILNNERSKGTGVVSETKIKWTFLLFRYILLIIMSKTYNPKKKKEDNPWVFGAPRDQERKKYH